MNAQGQITFRRFVGTDCFVAPETYAGLPWTPKSDMWAAGAVLYELLTSERAFGDPDGDFPILLKKLETNFERSN